MNPHTSTRPPFPINPYLYARIVFKCALLVLIFHGSGLRNSGEATIGFKTSRLDELSNKYESGLDTASVTYVWIEFAFVIKFTNSARFF